MLHASAQRPSADDKSVLAHGINLGLTRMADVCRGVTMRQLAWVHDWRVREETYVAALALLIEAHRVMLLGKAWGSGTTSSFDGQYTCSTACSIIRPVCRLWEHYTDTGGVTEHVFGLCDLFGFRFAPRVLDLGDRRLYVFADAAQPVRLQPIIAGTINVGHIKAHWDELLRLAVSIRSGTSGASAMLKRLSAYARQNTATRRCCRRSRDRRTREGSSIAATQTRAVKAQHPGLSSAGGRPPRPLPYVSCRRQSRRPP
jgi:TnpA family transposase